MQRQRILFFLENTGKLSNNLLRHLYHFTHFYNAHFVTRCRQCSQLSKVPRFCWCACVCVGGGGNWYFLSKDVSS